MEYSILCFRPVADRGTAAGLLIPRSLTGVRRNDDGDVVGDDGEPVPPEAE